MKKYSLVKKLPFENSPEIGYISIEKSNGHHYWGGSWFNPVNHPEFWKEVIEKDYEILKVKLRDGHTITYENGVCVERSDSCSIQNTVKVEKSNRHCTVVSVKRLSDGEIFSVGDNINHSYQDKDNKTITKGYIIKKIYFIETERLAFYVGEGLNLGIKNMVKPLFTTEEGKKIFPGDSYWCVNTAPHLWSVWEQTARDKTQLAKTVKAFSDENGARGFLKLNKPEFSRNQVIALLEAAKCSHILRDITKELIINYTIINKNE